ncbi:hypothetical protein SFRURICE_001197 [Spodoptera frugiperda]|nr:hypothetical protein SFRURICE_001197 [Spodoptera frugiperda]
MNCAACNRKIDAGDLIKCVGCKVGYHYKCVNITTTAFRESQVQLKRAFKCQSCANVTQRIRVTDDTPVRGVSAAAGLVTDVEQNQSFEDEVQTTVQLASDELVDKVSSIIMAKLSAFELNILQEIKTTVAVLALENSKLRQELNEANKKCNAYEQQIKSLESERLLSKENDQARNIDTSTTMSLSVPMHTSPGYHDGNTPALPHTNNVRVAVLPGPSPAVTSYAAVARKEVSPKVNSVSDNEWIEVKNKRKPVRRGGNNSIATLKAVERRKFLHVWRLEKSTTEDQLREHIKLTLGEDSEVVRCDRADGRKQGGVMVVAGPRFQLRQVLVPSDVDIDKCKFELVCTAIYMNNRFLFACCVVYIPPLTEENEYMLMFNILEKWCVKYKNNFILIGDFNLYSCNNNIVNYFEYFMSFCGFTQFNKVPNCNNRQLDLVLSASAGAGVSVSVSAADEGILPVDAYHPALAVGIEINGRAPLSTRLSCDDVVLPADGGDAAAPCAPGGANASALYSNTRKKRSQYNFYKADYELLYSMLGSTDWSEMYDMTDLEDILDFFYDNIYSILDESVPLKKQCSKSKYVYPLWYTTEIISGLKTKAALHKRFKQNRSSIDYTNYSKFRSHIKKLINIAYVQHKNKLQCQFAKDPKSFWQFVRSQRGAMGKQAIVKDGKYLSDGECAQQFAAFFESVYSTDPPRLDPQEASASANTGNNTELLLEIRNEADCRCLQDDIDRIVQWSQENKLYFNESKCSTISFTRARSPLLHEYRLENTPLQRVTQVRDLGVYMTPELLFREHIMKICKKAYRNLGFLLRQTRDFTNISAVRALYDALVRSHLEHSAMIWAPHESKYSLMLERVQNKFTRHLYWKLYGVYPLYPLMYPSLFVLGMVGYNELKVRREFTLTTYLVKLIRGLEHNPDVLQRISLWVPDNYVGRRRRPPLLAVPVARTNLLAKAAVTRAIRNINVVHEQIDIFTCQQSEFTKILLYNLCYR